MDTEPDGGHAVRVVGRDQRGATAVIVALMMVVLLGMGAIVVDVGAMYQERRELQNGADAGALALAKICSTSSGCGTATATAGTYANANANDNVSAVDEVCGTAAGLTACANPPTVPAGANYVRVGTSTENSDGSTQVNFGLARVLGFTGKTVTASSTVAWGGPAAYTSMLPLTISTCELGQFTNDGQQLVDLPLPPYPSSPAEAVIDFHFINSPVPCPSGVPGWDAPGGFGWLNTGCGTTPILVGSLVPPDPGNGEPTCVKPLANTTGSGTVAPPLVHTVIDIPVYGAIVSGDYQISSFAAFYVTGYQFQNNNVHAEYDSDVPGSQCTRTQFQNSGVVLCGYFVNDPSPVPNGTVGGPSMGVTVIQVIQ
jgi:Flp pilus assembly protein TadG